MYHFPRHRLAFFHIPKTGGTSMFRFLIEQMRARGDEEREITLEMYHEPIGAKRRVLGDETFANTTILTTIRNPYAVVVSLYFWYRRKATEDHPDLDIYPESRTVSAMTFDQYIPWYIENEKSFEHYLLDEGRLPPNLRIVKLEDVDAGVDQVLNGELGLDLPVRIPMVRRTAHGPPLSYLTPDAIRQINKKYEWVFDRYYPHERVDAG